MTLPDNNPEKQTGDYSHDLIVKEAFDFIRDHRENPFFVYLPLTIPHAELAVPEDSLNKYKGRFPEPEPFLPKNEKGYGTQTHPRAAYAAMIDRMDGDIGRLLNLLTELGIDENTIVFFTSDNGPHREGGADPDFFDSSGPLRGRKRDLYEGGIRVPLLIRWPGHIAPGRTTDHVSAFWDVLPTLAQLAGLPDISETDGISFMPTLLAEPERQKTHTCLYWEFHEEGGQQAVRMGRWKGVRLNAIKNPDGPIELYDLSADIAETPNLADRHPNITAMIAAIMKQEHQPNPNFPFYDTEQNNTQ